MTDNESRELEAAIALYARATNISRHEAVEMVRAEVLRRAEAEAGPEGLQRCVLEAIRDRGLSADEANLILDDELEDRDMAPTGTPADKIWRLIHAGVEAKRLIDGVWSYGTP